MAPFDCETVGSIPKTNVGGTIPKNTSKQFRGDTQQHLTGTNAGTLSFFMSIPNNKKPLFFCTMDRILYTLSDLKALHSLY